MIVLLIVAAVAAIGFFLYSLSLLKINKNLLRFFRRVAELADVVEDSPPSYVLERLRKKLRTIEEELSIAQRSRENILTLLDNISDPIIFVEADGTITFANLAAQKITRSEPIARKIYEAIEDYYVIEMFEETVRTWQAQESKIVLYVSDEKRYYSCNMIPVILPRGERRVVIMMRDVTKEHELNELRKQFVSNVSHELRTPLTSIHGYAETLLSDPEMDAETRKRFLTIIENESARMSRMINDLLDLERLESGEARFEFKETDLCVVVNYVLSIVEPLANEHGVQVEIQCEPVSIWADQDRMVQMILNLVDNAIKYTSLKEIGDKRVKVRVTREGKHAIVAVSDTGPGIPKEALPRLFDRFYRVDKGRSRKMGGSGLGLSIVKSIVERHGGEISVNSEVGVGTTFIVKLPIEREVEA
ncbi:histidine kinase [Pseudothermotoga hypogea DSM 11164 = NBRC 106472]|uniref:histidine kinase n=1 Tax=Pseudothermotoga hypogea DSM 11164 = NBRC 106472 TaxID=1123384 RepID=A0A0X1KPG1_9THEM|nr:ATP-binding protein [Pseudothermotoga hypogea]AJC73195.1 histidine kinase [Pseudothermotoga hypogea DSM 11164 = NBRC 106472]